jgi:surface polysaccharide O-acyltransferase-like enzyme
MLRAIDEGGQTSVEAGRIVALDRARTFVTLLVLLHHSVVNYTYFGNGDKARWLGFDLIVLFNDSFFMALMFLISGLFVHDSLTRKGSAAFLRDRAFRLGIPFLVSVFVLMPIAYYPSFLRYHLPGTTDFNFFHFWWRTVTVGPWPSGPAWFLWVLLALDAMAAAISATAPQAFRAAGRWVGGLRDRPMAGFAAFLLFSIAIYLPPRLMVGDSAWFEPGHYPLPIQTSRILLYAGYFFTGVAVGAFGLRAGMLAERGELARRWPAWLGFAATFYAAILILIYAKHNWVADINALPLWWQTADGLTFAMFSAAMAFAVPAIYLRAAKAPLQWLDVLQPSAYGIYLVHYVFIIWLQYIVYDPAWSPYVKVAIVFTGTLFGSWAVVIVLRKVPFIARMI